MTRFTATTIPNVTRIPNSVGRVLVLDHDPERQALLADVVGRAGADIMLAGSGVEAMEQLATGEAQSLLVADLEDGSLRGFISWARPRYPGLAVIALADDIEGATELYRLGADIVETLPLDPDRLGAKLAAAMRRVPSDAGAPVIRAA